jgi:hypothetical protein
MRPGLEWNSGAVWTVGDMASGAVWPVGVMDSGGYGQWNYGCPE